MSNSSTDTLSLLERLLDAVDKCRATLADRRVLPEVVRRGIQADCDKAEWAAFEVAAALAEEHVDLSERAQALMARVRDKAANFEAEYRARYGDLGLETGDK
jgi:hypothetical protein